MTTMTLMTMKCRGFLKGVRPSAPEPRDRAMDSGSLGTQARSNRDAQFEPGTLYLSPNILIVSKTLYSAGYLRLRYPSQHFPPRSPGLLISNEERLLSSFRYLSCSLSSSSLVT